MTIVALSGYPEAVLGRSSIIVPLPPDAVLSDAVAAVAARHSALGPALLHANFQPRRSTKALLNGAMADLDTAIPVGASVTVLATLPCDG
ncbi:MAG: MoaD/ThiS family protein [Pseudonocardiaceae bacterium]